MENVIITTKCSPYASEIFSEAMVKRRSTWIEKAPHIMAPRLAVVLQYSIVSDNY